MQRVLSVLLHHIKWDNMHAFSATMIARGDNTVGLKLLRYADAYIDVLDIIRFNLPSDFEAKQAMLDRWAKRGLNRDLLQKVMNGEIDAKRAYLPNRTVSGMGMEVGELAAPCGFSTDDSGSCRDQPTQRRGLRGQISTPNPQRSSFNLLECSSFPLLECSSFSLLECG